MLSSSMAAIPHSCWLRQYSTPTRQYSSAIRLMKPQSEGSTSPIIIAVGSLGASADRLVERDLLPYAQRNIPVIAVAPDARSVLFPRYREKLVRKVIQGIV